MNSVIEQSWNLGQQHLAAGKYLSARMYLESAERAAWAARNARALARLYLPLLETRRQIRYLSVDGAIIIGDGDAARESCLVSHLTRQPMGAAILASSAARGLARRIRDRARQNHRPYEALLRQRSTVLSPGSERWSDGIGVRTAANANETVTPAAPETFIMILPPPGWHAPGTPGHAQARESIVLGWEALALRWQGLHRAAPGPWGELAWLRRALEIDPACEPISMRLMALAEGLARKQRKV